MMLSTSCSCFNNAASVTVIAFANMQTKPSLTATRNMKPLRRDHTGGNGAIADGVIHGHVAVSVYGSAMVRVRPVVTFIS